jgi:hypothetical protein
VVDSFASELAIGDSAQMASNQRQEFVNCGGIAITPAGQKRCDFASFGLHPENPPEYWTKHNSFPEFGGGVRNRKMSHSGVEESIA